MIICLRESWSIELVASFPGPAQLFVAKFFLFARGSAWERGYWARPIYFYVTQEVEGGA